MIELRDIVFRYPHASREALSGASLRVEKGERVGIAGANGAGKTTLFHIVMGLLRSQSGEMTIFGEPRRRSHDFIEVRRRIGLLFQDSDDQLFCPTVGEDVAFGPLNLGRPRAEAREIAQNTLRRFGLAGFGRRLTHTLSGGEKRLAALASVIAMRPEALLLDEPVAGLDEDATERIVQFLVESGLTCVVISHEGGFLRRVCTRVVRLNEGRIVDRSKGSLPDAGC